MGNNVSCSLAFSPDMINLYQIATTMATKSPRRHSKTVHWKYESVCGCVQRRWNPACPVGRRWNHCSARRCYVSSHKGLDSWGYGFRQVMLVDVDLIVN